jgi:hypothetical protein
MKNLRIPEEYIYDLWLNRKLPSRLTTLDGSDIEILEPGIRNSDYAGPDFHNSKIRIGNITFSGDVEIDNFSTDWKAHGHHLNQRYNKTILHVVLKNNSHLSFSTNSTGRHIPVLEIHNLLDKNFRNKLEEKSDSDLVLMPCFQINNKMNTDEKLKYIRQLGLIRYKKKCLRILDRLKEIVLLQEYKISEPKINHNFHTTIKERKFFSKEFDNPSLWNQILCEEIFEALGYTKNKETMAKLGRSIEYEFVSKLDEKDFILNIESALFNISGLVPNVQKLRDEKSLEYVRDLLTRWDKLKANYNNNYFNVSNWHFYKLRPQNFPTVRLAAASRLLYRIFHQRLFSRLVENFSRNKDREKLNAFLIDNLIVKANGYWANHYNFSKEVRTKIKYFLGLGRIDEIITNCVLPILSVYFEIFDRKLENLKVLNLYINYYQKESNTLIDKVSQKLNIYEHRLKSVNYQGLLDLFRNYCIKNKCLECEIGKSVFNSL